MGTEGVVLESTSPVGIEDLRALAHRSDTVHPVVIVGKASSRPSHYRDFKFPEGIEDIGTISVFVGNAGIRTNPDTFIDATSEVLGELTVDISRDDRLIFCGLVDTHLHLGACSKAKAQECHQ